MKIFLPKYPSLLKILYPERISKVKDSNAIYLSFDDGPVPEITPWVLDILKDYKAKASFFCIGDNIRKHPEIYNRIIIEGHIAGNHTFNHLNGWKTENKGYLENTLKAQKVATEVNPETSTLFRPPYGRIRNSQAKAIRKAGFKIVVWDVISGDYDKEISPEKCFRNVTDTAEPGSTIVFHDSIKASKNLKAVLPKVLEYYSEKGFDFRSLKDVL
ncbi:polysaccharide deacetylase family protein [Christiangramia sp. SM2212]|uniref:Polysaccharide deacetylase family protein n=1 Tax=Christiangramia sediminicola TaxID=3073267 RepID=A0ABU1EMM7_9FLAO|nr:polysaccharide deacetylase family protein [Christiangramia sp. SM2212]MDR5589322.1 polysaccharide deacetylase family protein [Christiangramia sp. SM2212]